MTFNKRQIDLKILLERIKGICRDGVIPSAEDQSFPGRLRREAFEKALAQIELQFGRVVFQDWLSGKLNRDGWEGAADNITDVPEEVVDLHATSNVPFAVVRQEPVGHGGFHNGILETTKLRVRWVYDCGSWRKEGRRALLDAIDKFAKRVRSDGQKPFVELLFVSHFDSDHVWGLNALLKMVTVDTAIIPYLEPADVFAVLTGQAMHTSKDLFQVVADPVRWFAERRVRRIIFLRPRLPGGEDGPPVPEGPVSEGPLSTHEDGSLGVRIKQPDGKELETQLKHGVMVGEAVAGTLVQIKTNHGWADWWFLPYVHPISKMARDRLERAAKAAVGFEVNDARFNRKLKWRLRTPWGRRRLRSIYAGEELSDANGISLSLYAGPWTHGQRAVFRLPVINESKPTGWLLTGDAKLRNYDRRREWLDYFRVMSGHVGTLMLPHHGSSHNFHESILEAAPHGRVFVTADAHDRGRPHEDVESGVAAYFKGTKTIEKVSESSEGLCECSGPTRPTKRGYVGSNSSI